MYIEKKKQDSMKKVFITFAVGETYEKLSLVLKDSINSFSEYDLIIYNKEDFDINVDANSGYFVTIYKILSCIKSLEEYDEVVWLDTDCLATYNIDKVWNNKVTKYPLLPKHRFYNFDKWPHSKQNYCDPSFLESSKQVVGVTDNSFNDLYLQSCCMLFNKDCLPFLQESLSYYDNYNGETFPFGDETIINCMIWKNKYSDNLGDVFLCSHYFSPHTIEGFIKADNPEDYRRLFDISYRIEGVDEDFLLRHGVSKAYHNRIGLIENNFENVLFFHGSKLTEIHNGYLTLMK